MSISPEKPSLSALYKNEHIRCVIRDVLREDFEYAFDRLQREAKSLHSLMSRAAMLHKDEIKDMFIEYGYPLETLEDLKKILETLNVWENVDEADSAKSSCI